MLHGTPPIALHPPKGPGGQGRVQVLQKITYNVIICICHVSTTLVSFLLFDRFLATFLLYLEIGEIHYIGSLIQPILSADLTYTLRTPVSKLSCGPT